MSRFIDYLKSILTPEQYAIYQEQKRLDSVDSEARKRWGYYKRSIRMDTHLAWLISHGYVYMDDRNVAVWTNATKEK